MRIELVVYNIYVYISLVYRTQIQSYSTMFILYRYLAKIIYGPKSVTIHIWYYREYKIIYSEQQLSTSQVFTMNSWLESSVLSTYIQYFLHIRFISFWLKICTPPHYNIWILYFEFICICLTNSVYYWNFWYRELWCIYYTVLITYWTFF